MVFALMASSAIARSRLLANIWKEDLFGGTKLVDGTNWQKCTNDGYISFSNDYVQSMCVHVGFTVEWYSFKQ